MASNDIRLRVARAADAEAILAVYAPYIEKTAITFEYEVPDADAFRDRIEHTLRTYPYIVAEAGGCVLGYAYTSAFHPRAAYAHSVETSIYIDMNCRKMGLGRRLYNALEDLSRAQNILNLNASIATTDAPDAHLDNNSRAFHAHLGYRVVGEFTKCGYKFGTWYNTTWMEKMLGEHGADPAPVIPFPMLDKNVLIAAGLETD